MRSGIPYKVIGGTRFYDRREIKDALAYLKAVVNPVDEVSVKRVLNVPKRGVGDSTVGRLDAWANSHGVPFIDALRRIDEAGVTGRAVKGIETFLDAARRARRRAGRRAGPAELLEAILAAVGLRRRARGRAHASRPRAASRTWPSWSARPATSSPSTTFLEQVSLVADTDELDDDDSSVVLMTLHSAKGLEFPVGVPHRHGGRRLPAPALDRRARPARGGAPARLRRHHPGPRAALPHPRLEPHALRVHAVQPAEPVPRRDPRRSWSRSSRAAAAARGVARRAAASGIGTGSYRSDGYGSRRSSAASDDRSGTPTGRTFGAGTGPDESRRGRAWDEHRERVVESALRPTPPSPSGADQIGLKAGDDVRHNTLRRRRHPAHRGRRARRRWPSCTSPAPARSSSC